MWNVRTWTTNKNRPADGGLKLNTRPGVSVSRFSGGRHPKNLHCSKLTAKVRENRPPLTPKWGKTTRIFPTINFQHLWAKLIFPSIFWAKFAVSFSATMAKTRGAWFTRMARADLGVRINDIVITTSRGPSRWSAWGKNKKKRQASLAGANHPHLIAHLLVGQMVIHWSSAHDLSTARTKKRAKEEWW